MQAVRAAVEGQRRFELSLALYLTPLQLAAARRWCYTTDWQTNKWWVVRGSLLFCSSFLALSTVWLLTIGTAQRRTTKKKKLKTLQTLSYNCSSDPTGTTRQNEQWLTDVFPVLVRKNKQQHNDKIISHCMSVWQKGGTKSRRRSNGHLTVC